MYAKIAGEDPYKSPMRIYPAVHYTMGGLWVDYDLMSTVNGLFVGGEANFSDHGANRLGASALMQGLADGYFVAPSTIGNYLGSEGAKLPKVNENDPAFVESKKQSEDQLTRLMNINGKRTVDDFHRELGKNMWDHVGMSRNAKGLNEVLKTIPALREEFWKNVKITGPKDYTNHELEKAGRVADFLELGELMAKDALTREESCGGHFREEYQTPDNEAQRDDEKFCHSAAWEYKSTGQHERHKEELKFENIKLASRSYK